MEKTRMKLLSVAIPLACGLALLLMGCVSEKAQNAPGDDQFQDLLRPPDAVTIITEAGAVELAPAADAWKGDDIEVTTRVKEGGLRIELAAPRAALKYLILRWKGNLPADWKYLGDAWERSYGDLEWRPLDGEREMPWYFLASDGGVTHGYGVMTGPAAMCAWKADPQGVSLTADVRCGGAGVRLGNRILPVCVVTSRRGKAGARPGIWIHLITAQSGQPDAWRLRHNPQILDISRPEVRAYVKETVARLRAWGYDLIKHDYSGSDLAGYTRAAPDQAATWAYQDRTRTSAEIILDHYRSIREAAGEDGLIIGCNTIGHLAAGLFELQRIGDDTSGLDWNRVCNRGVNTLGFRAPQHGAFFAVDADCVGLTKAEAIPWAHNKQWLDLLARSGTPLFISFKKGALTLEQEKAVAQALEIASRPQTLGEPLDWFEITNPTRGLDPMSHLEGGAAPRRWKLMDKVVEYDW
jgi:hypothetical protein